MMKALGSTMDGIDGLTPMTSIKSTTLKNCGGNIIFGWNINKVHMKVDRIKYSVEFQTAIGLHRWFGMEAELIEGDDVKQCSKELKSTVENMASSQNGNQYDAV